MADESQRTAKERQRQGVMLQVQLTPEFKARLVGLAKANGRSLSDEVLHALERHLAAPPQLVTPAHKTDAPAPGA